MSEHTPEPWTTAEELGVSNPLYSGLIANLGDVEGQLVAIVVDRVVAHHEHMPNARRVVACVNACAGIPTADLEREGFLERARLYARPLKDLEEAKRLLSYVEEGVRFGDIQWRKGVNGNTFALIEAFLEKKSPGGRP